MICRPLIFSYHSCTPTYLRGERWIKGKRDKVFVGSRPHVTCLCGGLNVYVTYECACITTHNYLIIDLRIVLVTIHIFQRTSIYQNSYASHGISIKPT